MIVHSGNGCILENTRVSQVKCAELQQGRQWGRWGGGEEEHGGGGKGGMGKGSMGIQKAEHVEGGHGEGGGEDGEEEHGEEEHGEGGYGGCRGEMLQECTVNPTLPTQAGVPVDVPCIRAGSTHA